LNTEGLECVRCRRRAEDANGFTFAEQRRLEPAEAGERLERSLPGTEVYEIADGHVGLRQAAPQVAVPQDDQPPRLFERQRAEQHRLDDGEECRVGADPQRKGQERRCGETGLPSEQTQCLAEVVGPHGGIRRSKTPWRWAKG
jgi:hypothetical protein